jgi:hypothetical protein
MLERVVHPMVLATKISQKVFKIGFVELSNEVVSKDYSNRKLKKAVY